MNRIHLLSGWLLIFALFLASCESYQDQPGQVSGGLPGQTPLAGKQIPGQPGTGMSNPDVMTNVNPNPPAPVTPQVTITPQAPLTHAARTGAGGSVTDWPVYQDTVNHFQISYPPQFEFKVLDNSELGKLKPEPVTGTYFNDSPTTPGLLVPPKFSLRIYKIGAGTSVENWLKTNGLYLPDSDWTIAKYQGEHFSGYQVNSPLYMAPGWFIYAVQGDYLFQLTPLGQDAEKMLTTFEFTN
jgi:hypothetical protein